jgi:multidrug resistance efflux pump
MSQTAPVRIRFNPGPDPQNLLRPDMSVEPRSKGVKFEGS